MQKKREGISALATQEECEPVDLLQETLAENSGQDPAEDEKRYTVEVDGNDVELTLDQLLELARLCLTMNSMESSAAQSVLYDVPELLEFVQNYPDVKAFPPEVETLIQQGKQPLDAYRSYENSQLRKKLHAFEQNENNQKRSLGSVRGEADIDELDDLMAVYNAVFK